MSGHPAVKLDDLEDALMFVGSSGAINNAAWLCRETGEMLWYADDGGDWEPLPEDIEDENRYVAIPDKCELGLGKSLALGFARAHLPECFEEVQRMFSHRHAYGRFKDLLDRHGSLEPWYQWEQEKTRQALREWCADNGIDLAD